MQNKKLWFEDWFDSPYYHLLYGNRDQTEAARFIDKLIHFLQPPADSTFLDLACGKGRHAQEIANHGFKTTGIDLSENSISEANNIEDVLLDFHVGDMRHVHFPNRFDYIFNLFTSFGYFDTSDGQKDTLNAIHKQLKNNGLLVIDYLNVAKAEKDIASMPDRTIEMNGIHFSTRKRVSNQFISKEINIRDNGDDYTYYEHIWRLTLPDFEKLLKNSGFSIQTIFGDYELNSFTPGTSERLIIVAKQ